MIRIQDFGELVYGGAVTLADWWDNKRITEGRIGNADVLKKASFYTYLGVGLAATMMSVFGWMRRYERWSEHISHGFLYDVPRFAYNLSKTLGAGSSGGTGSAAVREAQRLMQTQKNQAALGAGRTAERAADRSYQPEFNAAQAF